MKFPEMPKIAWVILTVGFVVIVAFVIGGILTHFDVNIINYANNFFDEKLKWVRFPSKSA